jgi:excisionase family DNA binding protein
VITYRKRWLRTKDAALKLGVHQYTIQKWVREGRIDFIKLGSRPIYLVDIEAFKRKNAHEQTTASGVITELENQAT